MLAIIAKLKVTPGKESEFEKVMLGLAKDVRANEPGNKLYTLTKSEAGEYIVMELYDTEVHSRRMARALISKHGDRSSPA